MRTFTYTDFKNESNNNKVWKIEINGSVVTTHYGRIGAILTPSSKTFSNEYAAQHFVVKKIQEKLDKGYTEIEVVSGGEIKSDTFSKQKAVDEISKDPDVRKFVERIVEANKHSILQSSKSFTLNTDGLIQTPLGIVTPKLVDEARGHLTEASKNPSRQELAEITSKYLRLIPHDTGMKADLSILSTSERIQKENDLLDSLLQSYQMVIDRPVKDENSDVYVPLFDIDFKLINNSNEAMRVAKYFEESKSGYHTDWRKTARVRNVFSLNLNQRKPIVREDNGIEVFHGTGMGNLLSIMKNGLVASPPSTVLISGKMFGNGIYGAINSSKSMGYVSSRDDTMWMFVCLFQMGNYYHPYRTIQLPPNGYNSVWARKADCGLAHDELIVYQDERAQITHLIEFTER